MSELREHYEIFIGENLKTGAEVALQRLGSFAAGRAMLERYAFDGGQRIVDPSLETYVAGIRLENPVAVGAGWDKTGRALHGLHSLGFSSGEVGTVLPFGQRGNSKPRLWTIDPYHSVGLNRLGYNSPGIEPVDENLSEALPLPFPIGLNVGRNKIMENDMAPWAHSKVIKSLGKYASYITLGISTPNSPGLRGLQEKEPLRELIQAGQAAISDALLFIPMFVKIDAERTEHELEDIIEVSLEEGLDGIVATNSYMGHDLKAKYGKRWAMEAGGLSGADPDYCKKSTDTIRFIDKESGGKLAIWGVGGVDSAGTALEKIKAGASAVQVVTAIRPTRGKVAAIINRDLRDYLQKENIKNIQELIGADNR